MSLTLDPCPDCGRSNLAGVEVRNVYDGVLYWLCEQCDYAIPRDFTSAHRLRQLSIEYADRYNARKRPGRE